MQTTFTRRAALGCLMALPAIRTGRAAEATTFLLPAPSYLPAFIPYHLARSRGYFSKAGLDVSFQTARGGADAAKQVAVGNAAFGGGVGETSMIVRANGLPVRSVLLLGGKSIFQLAARQSANIASFKDLKGKKVGVIGYQDTSYYSLLGVLAASGLKRTDLQVEAVGPAGITQLMISGSLDAIMATPDWATAIEAAKVSLTMMPIDPVFPAMAQAVFSSDKLLAGKPDMAQGFVQAIKHALNDCLDDPASAAREFVAAVPQQTGKEADMERILRLYCSDVYVTVPKTNLGLFDPKRLETVQKFYIANDIVQTAVPVDELYTNQFAAG